jgi:hypothetical protein
MRRVFGTLFVVAGAFVSLAGVAESAFARGPQGWLPTPGAWNDFVCQYGWTPAIIRKCPTGGFCPPCLCIPCAWTICCPWKGQICNYGTPPGPGIGCKARFTGIFPDGTGACGGFSCRYVTTTMPCDTSTELCAGCM